ncbi:MAG: FkbM family methyltransferase [Nitritalea sp.]
MMEQLAAKLARNVYWIPGGYFIAKALRLLFFQVDKRKENRRYSFRGVTFDIQPEQQMGAAMYWRGSHDWAPIFAMERVLKPGDTVLDIGANQGEYTLWAARKVGPAGRVYAFEPFPPLFSQLCTHVSLNPAFDERIVCLPLGLAETAGRQMLYTRAGANEGVNTLFQDAQHQQPLEVIELDTLDSVCKRQGIKHVDFVKIDIEGAELAALKGAEQTLRKHLPTLLLEVNKKACAAAGYTAEELVGYLQTLGYTRFERVGLRGRLEPLGKLPAFSNLIIKP